MTGVSASADTGSDKLAGIENLVGGSGADTLTGDANDNVITGGAGNDTVVGGAGNDTFLATLGDGNDSYNGGAGTDTYDLSGTTAAATVTLGGAAPQATSADTGADTLISIENVIGGAGSDTINGDANNNVLTGGAGNDTLNGNGGNDTLNGGDGNDTMNGGAGNDTNARWPRQRPLHRRQCSRRGDGSRRRRHRYGQYLCHLYSGPSAPQSLILRLTSESMPPATPEINA